jgi:drug/metabolite transporter (DMT)-like permease
MQILNTMSVNSLELTIDPIDATENIPLISKSSDCDYSFDTFDKSSSFESHEFHQDRFKQNGDCCDETLPTLLEGVVEDFHDITEAALEEFQKADKDENYMIEIRIARSTSLLREDLAEASDAFHGNQLPSEDNYDIESLSFIHKESSTTVPLSIYLMLASAIVAMSTIGPLLQLQGNTTATMKVLWRMSGTSLILAPLALTDMYHYGDILKVTSSQWITFLLSTLCFVVMSIGFCISLDYTTVGNAVILSNSLALILLVGKFLSGVSVTSMEVTGAAIAFGGAVLCSRDSANSTDSESQLGTTIIGDLLAIVSAIGGVGYVTFAKTSRAYMSLYTFMFLTMFIGAAMVLVFQVIVLKETVTWDCDVTNGIGGFLVLNRFDRLPLELMMVVIGNLGGIMGYVRAMPHFDSLVICSVQLLEPVISEFLSFFAGVGTLPGLVGWIGNAAVAGGTYIVLCQSQKSSNTAEKC